MEGDLTARTGTFPRMKDTARRLLSGCKDRSLEVDDLVQEARIAIYVRRDQILASPDPVASCYVAGQQAMINAVAQANRRCPCDTPRRASVGASEARGGAAEPAEVGAAGPQ